MDTKSKLKSGMKPPQTGKKHEAEKSKEKESKMSKTSKKTGTKKQKVGEEWVKNTY